MTEIHLSGSAKKLGNWIFRLLLLVLLAAPGCRPKKPQTTIEIKNFSAQTVIVHSITDLKMNSGEITLGPKIISITRTESQIIPDEFSIFWKYDRGTDRSTSLQSSRISLSAIPSSQHTSKIVLEFNSEEQWVAHFE